MSQSPCPSCRSSNVYRTKKPISSGGGYAPNLLIGVGPWYKSARVKVVVCAECGLIRQLAEREARQGLRDADKWERV